jgi:hypothetical protein
VEIVVNSLSKYITSPATHPFTTGTGNPFLLTSSTIGFIQVSQRDVVEVRTNSNNMGLMTVGLYFK